jgi:hypothetical protein
MIRLIVEHADGATIYVPAPCRGCVSGVKAVFQANTVEVNDTIVVARDSTAVNTLTVVNTAGLVVETGVPDATNKGLIFDPDSTTAVNQVMKITDTGNPGAKIILIEFDEFAFVAQAPLEA